LPSTDPTARSPRHRYGGEPELRAIIDARSSGEPVRPSPEWTLTYLLLTRRTPEEVQRTVNRWPRVGRYARSADLLVYLMQRREQRDTIAALDARAVDETIDEQERFAAAGQAQSLRERADELDERYAIDQQYAVE